MHQPDLWATERRLIYLFNLESLADSRGRRKENKAASTKSTCKKWFMAKKPGLLPFIAAKTLSETNRFISHLSPKEHFDPSQLQNSGFRG